MPSQLMIALIMVINYTNQPNLDRSSAYNMLKRCNKMTSACEARPIYKQTNGGENDLIHLSVQFWSHPLNIAVNHEANFKPWVCFLLLHLSLARGDDHASSLLTCYEFLMEL